MTEAPQSAPPATVLGRLGGPALGALEGVALALPTTLGGVLLVYTQVGAAYIGAGMLAAMVGMVLVHLATLPSARPMVYSARLFEAATLAAILSELAGPLRAWGITDSPQLRLGYLVLVVVIGSGFSVLLYLFRADRLIRFIPTPVFRGFANSIAVLLLISQAETLWRLLGEGHDAQSLWVVMAVALGTMWLVRRHLGHLPAAAVGLAAGALVAQFEQWMGHPSTMLASTARGLQLPVVDAYFGFLVESPAHTVALVAALLSQGAIVGMMSFINHNVAVGAVSQADGREAMGLTQRTLPAFCGMATGALGALPIIGSLQSTLGASRLRPISSATVAACAVCWGLVLWLGLPWWMPVAAVCGVMVFDAFTIADAPSFQQLWRWLTRQRLSANAREDLSLVVCVTLTAVIYNLVAAVFVGLLLGLLLFAVRNARKPVRRVWTGAQVRSNCARSRTERDILDRDGKAIRVFELEGDLFFGAASVLEQALLPQLGGVRVAVIDWTGVRHLDTSVAQTVKKLGQRLQAADQDLLHAGVRAQGAVDAALTEQGVEQARFPDLDRALEVAENRLVSDARAESDPLLASEEVPSLLRGLEPPDAERVSALMLHQHYQDGETVFEAGDTGRDLIWVVKGSANVVVQTAGGEELRLAAVRPGALLGEVGFLDGAPRSATIRARGALEVARLTRDHFDRLGQEHPPLAQRLLSNIAVDLATRLRSTNALLTARGRSA